MRLAARPDYRTGQAIVEQALVRGWQATTFVRSAAKLPISHERLKIVSGWP